MVIEIDQVEARMLLELLREDEKRTIGGRSTADSDINPIRLGVVHGVITKIDDAYMGSIAA